MKKKIISLSIIALILYSFLIFKIDNVQKSTENELGRRTEGGVFTFIELLDVPSVYTGEAGNCAKVNGAEDSLEFGTCGTGSGLADDDWATSTNLVYNNTDTVLIGSSSTSTSEILEVNGNIGMAGTGSLVNYYGSACAADNYMYDIADDGTFACRADANTTYTATGTLLSLTGTEFGINEGTLTDTKLCTYEAGTGLECNTDPGGGSGDVTSVGDCASGACYDGSSDGGTYARLYDGDSHYSQLSSGNVAGNVTLTLPTATGNLAYNGNNLDFFNDVDYSDAPATGDVLYYDSLTPAWLASTGAPAEGKFLGYDGTVVWDTVAMSDLTFTAGTSLTLTTNTLNVDDDFLLNDGDIGTGVYDFGGATSFEIVNGASPTVDAAGEIAVDTTNDDQLIYYGDEKNVISPLLEKCFTMATSSIATYEDSYIWHPYRAIEVIEERCRVVDGTSQVMNISDGTNDMDSITCATTLTKDSSLTNNTWTADEGMTVEFGTTTGEVTTVNFCIIYKITAD